jgi:hypothetical protein
MLLSRTESSGVAALSCRWTLSARAYVTTGRPGNLLCPQLNTPRWRGRCRHTFLCAHTEREEHTHRGGQPGLSAGPSQGRHRVDQRHDMHAGHCGRLKTWALLQTPNVADVGLARTQARQSLHDHSRVQYQPASVEHVCGGMGWQNVRAR